MTSKVFLENPYLRQIEAKIINKSYRDNKYQIITDKTIFCPRQKNIDFKDRGSINGLELVDVYEERGELVHVLRGNIETDLVHMSLDWQNRFDYMQKISAQQLISSSLKKLFNLETKALSFQQDLSFIDIEKKSLSRYSIGRLEGLVNKIVFSNFPMASFLDCQKVGSLDGLKENSAHYCPPIYVRNTGEIGLIKIDRLEENPEGLRIYFLAGQKALEDYDFKNKYLKNLSLNFQSKDLKENISELIERNNRLEDELEENKASFYDFLIWSLKDSGKSYGKLKYINKDLEELSLKDLSYASDLLVQEDNYVFALRLREREDYLILGYSKNLEFDPSSIFKPLIDKYNLKGALTKNMLQAQLDPRSDEIIETFFANIKSYSLL